MATSERLPRDAYVKQHVLRSDIATIEAPSSWIQSTDGVRLVVKSRGAGAATCLLVHGFADGAYVWDTFMQARAAVERTVAVDLRGHGDSDWDRCGNYDIATHTADVNQIIDVLAEERIILIGHSLGAHVSIRLAVMRPELLAAVVLVDFGPDLNEEGMLHGRENLRASFHHSNSIGAYANFLGRSRPLLSAERCEQLATSALRPVGGGYELRLDPALADFEEPFDQHDESILWRMLGGIRCPTLVVRGAGSAMLTRAVAESMVRVLPRGRLSTISGAGHAVMTDNPDEFNTVVGRFVEQISRGAVG